LTLAMAAFGRKVTYARFTMQVSDSFKVNSHWSALRARHPMRHGINQWNECYGKWWIKWNIFIGCVQRKK